MKLEYYLKGKMNELLNLVLNDEINEETKKSYKYFSIILSKKIQKKNESYKDRTITIYNLYRQECEIVNSLIIGLAHHLDFCNRGETDNTKPFLILYETLLYEALEQKMICFEELKNADDYESKVFRNKSLKEVLNNYWQPNDNEEKCILEVSNCYAIKDYLKGQGFKYNMFHQTWEIEVFTNKVNQIIEALYEKDLSIIVETRSPNKILFGLMAYICISGNTYKYRNILKDEHYYYKDSKWYKKIQANMYLTEKGNIEKILPAGQGLKISIEF